LNPAATDFRAVALQIASDIPYPERYASWRDLILAEYFPIQEVGTDLGAYAAGLVSTGALHGWFAASAFCAWVQSWRQAAIAGDANAAAQAAQTIAQAVESVATLGRAVHRLEVVDRDPQATLLQRRAPGDRTRRSCVSTRSSPLSKRFA
jgi:hypothetical protein